MSTAFQIPTPPDTLPSFSWQQVMNWENLSADLLAVAAILTGSLIVYRLITLIVRRIVTREIEEEDPLVKRLREQRAQTLGGLLTSVAAVVVIIVAVLTILSRFINIAPLLAGVSVIGLAVSFGAQSLVKDVISGTFMLVEGQFGIGDVVRLGETSGLVEKITLRTTILRDLHGIVHIIPNGEITRVSNLTKTWSRAVIDVAIAYREDVERVIEILRGIGRELQADPNWGPLLLEPPEVLGIDSFADSGIIIRMTAKTLPLKQWEIARELRLRIKKRFDAEDIEIPFPHIKFYWGDGQMPTVENTTDRTAR